MKHLILTSLTSFLLISCAADENFNQVNAGENQLGYENKNAKSFSRCFPTPNREIIEGHDQCRDFNRCTHCQTELSCIAGTRKDTSFRGSNYVCFCKYNTTAPSIETTGITDYVGNWLCIKKWNKPCISWIITHDLFLQEWHIFLHLSLLLLTVSIRDLLPNRTATPNQRLWTFSPKSLFSFNGQGLAVTR